MEIKSELLNYRQAVKELDKLPDSFQRQVILKMLRKSTRPLIRDAKSRLLAHGRQFTELSKSIGNITAKSKNPIIFVGPRVKGKFKYVGYIAHWVEFGSYGRAKGMRYKPFPFMRPAIDSKTPEIKNAVVSNFTTHLKLAVDKAAARLK